MDELEFAPPSFGRHWDCGEWAHLVSDKAPTSRFARIDKLSASNIDGKRLLTVQNISTSLTTFL